MAIWRTVFLQLSLVGQHKLHTARCKFDIADIPQRMLFFLCALEVTKTADCVCVCLLSVRRQDISLAAVGVTYCCLSRMCTNKHDMRLSGETKCSRNPNLSFYIYCSYFLDSFGKSYLFMHLRVTRFCLNSFFVYKDIL